MRIKWLIIILSASCVQICQAANILVLSPFFGKSHSIIMNSISLNLASIGHNITTITFNMIDDPPPNVQQIKIDRSPLIDIVKKNSPFNDAKDTVFDQLSKFWGYGTQGQRDILNSKTVQDFINNDKTHFDLVISELFYQESLYMFAYKYKTPLVLVVTSTMFYQVSDFMGSPLHLSYTYHEANKKNGDSVLEKLENYIICFYDQFMRRWNYLPEIDKIAKYHFQNVSTELPSINSLEKNVSLVLINSHFSFDRVIPLVPGIVEVGGLHLGENKPLPKDVQKFLDEATDGAILFALGSHLQSMDMRADILESFIHVFKSIKQRIIWKWENDNPPILDNLMTMKWTPQFDILAHPNVKLFINHGGMLGIQESIYHGVPILGIPIFADQCRNIAILSSKNAAIKMSYDSIDKQTIKNALDKMLNNEIYLKSAKKLSSLYKDRQNKPMETARYWIEYVIRHKDPKILKTPLAYMSFLDKYLVEMILIVLVLTVIHMIYALVKMLRSIKNVKKIKSETKKNL